MPATYEKIATTTLGSNAASITLGSIPATYTDLRIVIKAKGDGGEIYPRGYFNGSVSNISNTFLTGTGTTATSGSNTSAYFLMTANVFPDDTYWTFITIDIFSYAGSTYKTSLTTISMDKNGTGGTRQSCTLYQNTAAITSFTFNDGGAGWGFAPGTTATIYGILKA